VKANPVRVSKQPQSEDAPALQGSLAAASVRDSNLSGLMSSASSSVSRPSLATVKLSQGVSQGLLIKRVQPKYPTSALAVHKEGAVQIEATINKEGNVNNLKVLSGDAVLARAALEAVRQWRYKPYYLNGEPVEIQTQITVNFKAN
jgi:protein TonB